MVALSLDRHSWHLSENRSSFLGSSAMRITGRILVDHSSEHSLKAREDSTKDIGLKPIACLLHVAIGCVEDAVELKKTIRRLA
jgi:hypothetical protein